MMKSPRRQLFSNGAMLTTCAFGMGSSCLSLTNYASGAFVRPLSHEFGWSRGGILFGYSAITLVTIFTSQGIGYLADRVSPRLIVVPGQIAFGFGFILMGLLATSDIHRFYILNIVLAILAAGSLPITFNRVVAGRFVGNRGFALGIIATGSGLCGLTIPPYLALLIEHFGWRGAYVGLGLVPIAGALLLSLPFLPVSSVKSVEQGPIHIVEESRPDGISLKQAIRGYRLWVIALSLAIGGGLSTGVVSNFMPLLRDQGLSTMTAAGALSAFGLSVIIGRLTVGTLIDRFWAPPVALSVMVPAACALLVLAFIPVTGPIAYGCAILMGLAAGAEGDMLWFLGARYFGLAHVGRIYAFLYIFFTAGIGMAAPIFGAVYDHFGSYQPALIGAAGAWMVCGGILLTLGRYPDAAVPQHLPKETSLPSILAEHGGAVAPAG